MYSKGKDFVKAAGCILIIFSGYLVFSLSAEEIVVVQTPSLKLVPNKCVALRKGRKCFATIKVNWRTELASQYCLRRVSDQLEINCWEAATTGKFSYVFSSSTDEQLELVRTEDEKILVSSKVKVSWVYSSNKRRKRWRVF